MPKETGASSNSEKVTKPKRYWNVLYRQMNMLMFSMDLRTYNLNAFDHFNTQTHTHTLTPYCVSDWHSSDG